MPRSKSDKKRRSWSSKWIAQNTGRCTACRRKRPLMLIEHPVQVCAECHEQHLEKWRQTDIEAEAREMRWDLWDLTAAGRL